MQAIFEGLNNGSLKTNVPPASRTPTELPSPTQTIAPLPTKVLSNYTCIDPLGCVKIGPSDPIHIAYLLAMSGLSGSIGVDAHNGIELAIDDAGGTILGHPILFDGVDSRCNAEGGNVAANKLAKDPSILAVIGPSCSSEARTAIPLLSQAGFTIMSPSNTAADLTDPTSLNHFAGYFRTAHNDNVQGVAAADFVYNFLKLNTVATVNDGTLYSKGLLKAFVDSFRNLGGTVTTQASIIPSTTDASAALGSVASGKPELIYMPISMPAGAVVISQAKSVPGLETTELLAAHSLYTKAVVDSAGESIEGVYVSCPFVTGAAYDEFVAKYEEKFGMKPIDIFHAHAYDAFNIIKAAIEKVAVQDPDGTLYISRQALREAVAETKDFNGITGVLTCSAEGDCANPVIGFYEYHTGQFPPDLVWPER
jgi:branched-chain amino acid transport system substrate-binding protein